MIAAPSASKLYTPAILALAVSLAEYPFDPAMPLHGAARSRACGSSVELSAVTDVAGGIARFGLKVRACAIGQAAAAIFAKGAHGQNLERVGQCLAGLEAWLGDDSPVPDWPGLMMLEAATAFPARHGAILLPWKAAQAALGKGIGAG